MRLHFLVASWQRSWGAMFYENLRQDIFAFVYPTDASRTFHTFFCPPLRIVALRVDGQILFDEVVSTWRFVKLPPCRYVIETDPKTDYRPYMNTILSLSPTLPQLGALEPDTRFDSLLFALLSEAVADMRRVRETHGKVIQPEVHRRKFQVWERGQMVSSAGFLLDFSQAWDLPGTAVRLSYSVLKAEEPYLDEIVAASVAGIPWKHEFPDHCIRCGKVASWRSVLRPAPDAPVEITWRYQRPENCIPICHHCMEILDLQNNDMPQFDMVWGLWGPRFEAFWQWHKASQRASLPKWDMYTHPLWPPEFGGDTWETGSGRLQHAEPRPPRNIARAAHHEQALRRVLYSRDIRKRQPRESPLQKLLHFHLEPSEGESQ